VGGREYTWHDVWAAARKGSSWTALEREVGEGIALQKAERTAPDDEVRAEGQEFRRTRRLHAGEDAEAWLTAREVTLAEWHDYLERVVLRRVHPGPKPARPTARAVEVTGWCSGAFDDMARDLAVQVLGVGSVRPKAADVAALIERNRLDWIRVDAEVAIFRNDDTAREAIQCVKADGMGLADVAKAAKATTNRISARLDELTADVRTRLLPAVPGEVLGPVRDDEGSAVYVVNDKILPATDDPAIVAMARDRLIDATVQRALEDHVTWHEPG
jgi:hypothetical protein